MTSPVLSREECERRIAVLNECLSEGFPLITSGRKPSARSEAARRLGVNYDVILKTMARAERDYGLKPDVTLYRPRPAFEVAELTPYDSMTAEELLDAQAARHAERKSADLGRDLIDVRIGVDGPIGIAFFGDPHLDDPGFAAADLRRDVEACRDTEGMYAVCVGDLSNNWIGRLMSKYADQEITRGQALTLIEWFFTSLPWLLTIGGNHDRWGSEHGDVHAVIHRLRNSPGLYQDHGARLRLNLPSGCAVNLHVRHDFPGGSQFNPAHALVRETLFGFRDHVLVCGHRHSTGYIPIFHKDPRRLCQGLRVGTYKDFDDYAKEKHFHGENWARGMGVVIDPTFADDPVRFVKTCFSISETAEYLTWRRELWAQRQAA